MYPSSSTMAQQQTVAHEKPPITPLQRSEPSSRCAPTMSLPFILGFSRGQLLSSPSNLGRNSFLILTTKPPSQISQLCAPESSKAHPSNYKPPKDTMSSKKDHERETQEPVKGETSQQSEKDIQTTATSARDLETAAGATKDEHPVTSYEINMAELLKTSNRLLEEGKQLLAEGRRQPRSRHADRVANYVPPGDFLHEEPGTDPRELSNKPGWYAHDLKD
ncbi:hypothetical protein VM1G_09615 [Cytospora mali]|uniref:Uncharacterized protein n=1 Tax=Cytospora mali TaxID=578113 RepID=A0A194WBD1_CYTMA|nr:hypothetical protein VM1G_09615 [Valsa mali]